MAQTSVNKLENRKVCLRLYRKEHCKKKKSERCLHSVLASVVIVIDRLQVMLSEMCLSYDYICLCFMRVKFKIMSIQISRFILYSMQIIRETHEIKSNGLERINR